MSYHTSDSEAHLPHDVFLSYSNQDKAIADRVCAALEGQGITCWIAPRDIMPGVTFGAAIIDAICQSGVMVLIFSSHANQSKQVSRELRRADDENVPVIPFRTEDVRASGDLDYFLGATQWLDAFRGDMDEHLPSLVRAVKGLLAKRGRFVVPAPTVAPPPEPPPPETPVEIEPPPREAEPAPTKKAEAPVSPPPEPVPVRVEPQPEPVISVASEPIAPPAPVQPPPALEPPPEPPDFWAWLRRWRWAVLGVVVVMAAGLLTWKWVTAPSAVPAKTNPADGQPYVWIPPGSFQMGCSPGDSECYDSEKPAHRVSISKGFWMGQTEVTQSAYEKVMGKNPSNSKGPQQPVEQVSWQEAGECCKAAGGRLPTEAEWEYAARAGTTGARYGDLNAIAWYDANTGSTRPVRTKQPNAWGLYDMLGNVYEWCSDSYGPYRSGEQTDPQGAASGEVRVVRGSSRGSRDVRVSYRGGANLSTFSSGWGFRCVREVIP